MELHLKYKTDTTIAVDRQQVPEFSAYINSRQETATVETYSCREGSMPILLLSGKEGSVYVQFHLNLAGDSRNQDIDMEGKIWFMNFCNQYGSEIENLRSGALLAVTDGAIMSDLFSARAAGLPVMLYNNPKDKRVKGKGNLKFS